MKITTLCRTTNTANPAKCGLKRMRIELAMLDFRPGAKQALPATTRIDGNCFSSSTTILWGFSHGATHSSGIPSGVDNDPGTSNTIGGLGGVPSNAHRDRVGSPVLSGRQVINCHTTHLHWGQRWCYPGGKLRVY